jgi:Fanconi anemia group M protein
MAHYARLCVDYVEVYGLDTLKRYLDRQQARTDLKRNEKSFLNHPKTREAIELLSKGIEQTHPKVDRLVEVLRAQRAKKPDSIAIVFAQYRDALSGLQEILQRAGFASERFIGQASRGGEAGLAQGAQKDVLARFARREFPVLLSTSVGEEGIDVPQVDLVAFYDAVPSEIRSIQRRGRTGRTVAGRVVLLVTKDSSDEGAYWAQQKRETKMKKLVSGYA